MTNKISHWPILILAVPILILSLSSKIFAAEKWKEYKGEHFIIYYKNAPQDFIKSVERMSESYYDEITDNLGLTRYRGWTWNNRALIYIYDNSDDYVSTAKQLNWSHGAASPRDKVIRTFPTAHGFFDSTLPHELGHIIFREFIGFKAQVPLWFEEGVAMYQEKARRWGSNEDVRFTLKNKSFLSLSELNLISLNSNSSQQLVQQFYAESASIVYYMIQELGEQRFVFFCKKLEDGTPFESALHSIYIRFNDLKDLNKSWVNYLTKVK
jgi:hypothetical protein